MNRISVRLLAFNLLVVFVPVVAFLSLGTYERQLLASQERALVQQARLLAAALEDTGAGMAAEAERVLIALRQRSDARLRVVGADGRLLVDSARFGPRAADRTADAAGRSGEADGTDGSARDASASAEETFLYRLASFPVRLWRRWASPPRPPLETDDFYAGADALLGAEVRAALDGRYGAATRVSASGQRSVTLYSAIPVFGAGRVAGAVLASQSTYRILVDLYDLRLDVFILFLGSVAAAAALSLLAAATITIPIRRLRDQARSVLDARGRLAGQVRAVAAPRRGGRPLAQPRRPLPRPRAEGRPAGELRLRRGARAAQPPRLDPLGRGAGRVRRGTARTGAPARVGHRGHPAHGAPDLGSARSVAAGLRRRVGGGGNR